MERSPNAANCRWAVPTLFLSAPAWLQAWDDPWSCVRDGEARPLDSTEPCADCPRWESGPKPDPTSPVQSVEVPVERWKEILEEFGVMHQGWLVSVDVLSSELGAQPEINDLPLLGVTAEPGRDGSIIAVSVGRSAAERFMHTMVAPSRVWLERPFDGSGRALQVESADGTKTILRFRTPERPDSVDDPARA